MKISSILYVFSAATEKKDTKNSILQEMKGTSNVTLPRIV